MLKNKKEENLKIKKAKEIIIEQKKKIKEEKKKIKIERQKKSKFAKFFFKDNQQTKEEVSLRSRLFLAIYFQFIGFVLCLIIIFFICGRRNIFKLYFELEKLINVYDTITMNYYGNLDKDKMVDKAIETMLSETGDAYTTYSNKEATTSFKENVEGTYEGIGCTVSMNDDGEIYIVSIFEDSPAFNAGIKENDIILKIDGVDYYDKTSSDMAEYVKNSKKSTVKLVIKRNGKEKNITIKRSKVALPTVVSKIFELEEKKIGYIDISVFSSVTGTQFKKELEKIEKEKIDGLIIDVRNNSGGYLTSVTEISNLFLEKGQTIYQLQNKKNNEIIKDTTKESRSYPISVLINSASASASEILASAIKESYNGIIVGVNSYGKGTVQKTKQLSDGTMIKYTIQNWLTPDGKNINEIGVEPTHYVELKLMEETKVDNQLELAQTLILDKLK